MVVHYMNMVKKNQKIITCLVNNISSSDNKQSNKHPGTYFMRKHETEKRFVEINETAAILQ